MDPFTIAALVAAVAGAYMQNKASQDAAANQQRAIQESLMRQQALQREAEQTALKKATEFNPDDRLSKQSQIEQQLTQQLLEPVQQNQARQEAPSVQGDVSSDYTAARAKSMTQQAKAADALARLFGRIGSAGQLRQNEAIGLGDTASKIGMLGNFSRGQAAADQVGINSAGIPDGNTMLAGSVLQGVGQVGLMGGFKGLSGASGSGASNVWAGAAPVSQSNNIGLTGAGRVGLRLFG